MMWLHKCIYQNTLGISKAPYPIEEIHGSATLLVHRRSRQDSSRNRVDKTRDHQLSIRVSKLSNIHALAVLEGLKMKHESKAGRTGGEVHIGRNTQFISYIYHGIQSISTTIPTSRPDSNRVSWWTASLTRGFCLAMIL
ncbi:unnamed protein product, partial [Vitis vinifera]